MHNIYVIFILV